VSDHIRLVAGFGGDSALKQAVEANLGLVARETLAQEVLLEEGEPAGAQRLELTDGRHVWASAERVVPAS
jgi:hypothetical protein